MRTVLLLACLALSACSREDREQTGRDARQLGSDIKQEVKKADAVVTKEAKDAREKVQEGARKLKNEAEGKK